MATITRDELQTMFMGLDRPLIATLLTDVEPDMVKKDRDTKEPNPYLGRIRKRSRVNGIIGAWNYTNSVNNQRVRESDAETVEEVEAVPVFEALPRAWGERLAGTALVHHKGQHYVEVKVERAIETVYVIDGEEATPEQIADLRRFLSKRDNEGQRQEVEKVIILRDYKLDNIRAVRVNGEQYDVN
jgi:hypothetical protein